MATTETSIAWTDRTWNPVRGCSRVSEGCRHCYAERVAARFSRPGLPFHDFATQRPARWTGKVALVEKDLHAPCSWRKPKRVFVNSMSDLFHEGLPFEDIRKVFTVMALPECDRHTFQILTKRPRRMLEFFEWARGLPTVWPWPDPLVLHNVWLGTSIEDQATADERIPLLLQAPAVVRFVSAEPLLGPVDLAPHFGAQPYECRDSFGPWLSRGLDWVIPGGESGPGARPCDVAWIRAIKDQCQAAGVPVFVKQLGSAYMDEFSPGCDRLVRPKDRKGGDPAEWPEDLRVRDFPGEGAR